MESLFGPSLSAPLTTRLTALSSSQNLTASQLYESWEAYSLTRNISTLTDETFKGFETHVRSAVKKVAPVSALKKRSVVNTNSALGKRQESTVTPSPAAKHMRSGLSAVDSLTTPSKSVVATPGSARSMGSASATVTPMKSSYGNRSGRNTVVFSYNPNNLSELARESSVVNVEIHPLSVAPSERHGFASLNVRSKSLEDRLLRMNTALCEGYDLKSEEEDMIVAMDGGETEDRAYWVPVGGMGQREIVCVGRVCNEVRFGVFMC